MNQHQQVQSIRHEEEHGIFPENHQAIINFWLGEPNAWKKHGPMIADRTSLDTFPPRAAGLESEGWSHVLLTLPSRRYWLLIVLLSVDLNLLKGIAQISLNHSSNGCDCQDSNPCAIHQAILSSVIHLFFL